MWACGMLYKAVAQTVLLYWSNSSVVMRAMLKVFEGVYHQVAQWIVGMTACHMYDGEWEYPPVADALETARLWPIK